MHTILEDTQTLKATQVYILSVDLILYEILLAIIKTTTALNNIVESTRGPGLSYLYRFTAPYTTAISYTTQKMVH